MSNVLQDIFKNHYEEMLYILHPRKSVIENVDRMINCGDPSFGGAMYGCAKCGTFKFVPFRCHSRFCPTCGTKYSIDRTTSTISSFSLLRIRTNFSPSVVNYPYATCRFLLPDFHPASRPSSFDPSDY